MFFLNKLKFYLTWIIFLVAHIPYALSAQGVCTPVNGTSVFSYSAEKDLPSIDAARAGSVLKNVYTFERDSHTYRMKGCDYDGPAYITTVSTLPLLSTDSDGTAWYKVNDYLAVSIDSYVAGNVEQYFHVPFYSKNNRQAPVLDSDKWDSGGKGSISLKILKPFVGFSRINQTIVSTYISTDENTGVAGMPASQVNMTLDVESPQTCELNSGDTITMNFGSIGAPLFSQAGAGNKPAGVNPQTKTIGIKCKNIDAQTMLSLRLEADNISGNAMVSDNKDVGFIVADADRRPLTPNNINSRIPFRLDDNASATVPVTAWPVSLTGNKPVEGRFTAEGYLRIDFD